MPISTNELSDRLYRHVDMLSEVIGPRHVGRPKQLAAAAAYVERELGRDGDVVARQTYEADGIEVANLIVERRGTRDPDSIVVLGAHYDTIPGTPGADDNASAIAVLIEVARLLAGKTSQRTVRYVAFPCEEPPHFHMHTMGSQVYARSCRERRERILGMLCLEMVGYYVDAPNSQQLPEGIPRSLSFLFPNRGNFLAAVGNLSSKKLAWNFRRGFKRGTRFPLFAICLPELIESIRFSDNSSFWDQGYPALMLTDTSFLRNPHYHERTDTADTLDYQRMAEVTRGVASAVALLSKLKLT